MGVGGQRHAPVALPQERAPVPLLQEAGWAPGLIRSDVEKRKISFLHSGFLTAKTRACTSRYTDYAIPTPRK
jgi:hypothetical protein